LKSTPILLVMIIMMVYQPKYESIVSDFPEQTVEKRGSLVFRICESSEAERERRSPLERMSVFAGNARRHVRPIMTIMGDLSFFWL